MISVQQVKELRNKTGAGLMECKKALVESNGDIEKAKEILEKKGIKIAEMKAGRLTNHGIVHSYIHSNNHVGVLIELGCETDFVANSENFKKLAHELCLQIAALNPICISKEDITPDIIEKQKEIYRAQLSDGKKPDHIVNKIMDGKLQKTFFNEACLLEQPSIRDSKVKIKTVLEKFIAVHKENIKVKRFVRYEI